MQGLVLIGDGQSGVVKGWCVPAGRAGGGLELGCGPSPRNARAGGEAAQAQGHSAIVSVATDTSLQGTWKGVGERELPAP